MFKFPNLIDDFKDLKFDSVSQALASSQTLISSFKSSVASIITKTINQDALIKGQTNGPDNLMVQIQDGISDLENIRDSYKVNLETIRGLTVPAFAPSTDEAISIRANGNSGITIYRAGIPIMQCKLNLSPSQPNEFVKEFKLCALPPDIVFIPRMTEVNNTPASLSSMYQSVQGIDDAMANNAYRTVYNIPSYSNPLWIAIRPLVLGNIRPGTNRWRDGLVTQDPIDIGNGKVAHLNICLVQGLEWHWVSYPTVAHLYPSVGILFSATIADANDFDLSGVITHKTAAFYKLVQGLGTTKITNANAIEHSVIRDSVNSTLTINNNWNNYPVIAELDRDAQSPDLRGSFKWDFENISRAMAQFVSGLDPSAGTVYEVPIGTAFPARSYAIDRMAFDEVSIETATVRTEDGYVLTDLTADINSITGDLVPKMNSIITDLGSAYYE